MTGKWQSAVKRLLHLGGRNGRRGGWRGKRSLRAGPQLSLEPDPTGPLPLPLESLLPGQASELWTTAALALPTNLTGPQGSNCFQVTKHRAPEQSQERKSIQHTRQDPGCHQFAEKQPRGRRQAYQLQPARDPRRRSAQGPGALQLHRAQSGSNDQKWRRQPRLR